MEAILFKRDSVKDVYCHSERIGNGPVEVKESVFQSPHTYAGSDRIKFVCSNPQYVINAVHYLI